MPILWVPEWRFVPPLTSSSRRRLSAWGNAVLFAWLMWLMEKYKFHTQAITGDKRDSFRFSLVSLMLSKKDKPRTTVNNGYLGSRNDEERSEMRYVMRIAEFSESSNFWTHIALSGYTWQYTSLTIGLITSPYVLEDRLSRGTVLGRTFLGWTLNWTDWNGRFGWTFRGLSGMAVLDGLFWGPSENCLGWSGNWFVGCPGRPCGSV